MVVLDYGSSVTRQMGVSLDQMAPRHCEPTGRRKAPPDDRLREAIHLAAQRKNGLLRRGVYHRARRRRDPLASRNDAEKPQSTASCLFRRSVTSISPGAWV